MSRSLTFHPEVRDEIDAARDWYERQRTGLGDDFVEEVERVLVDVAANPVRYAIVEGDIRARLLHRFPYVLYYRALTDCVRVVAVYHASRNSSGWKSRQ